MKVMHVVWSLQVGGVETMLVNIASAQAAAGADVSVLIINDNWNDELLASFDQRVRLLKVHKTLGSGNPDFLPRMNAMIRQENPDVIHLHGTELISLIWGAPAKKAVVTMHCLPRGPIRKPGILYRLFPKLDLKEWDSSVRNIDLIPQVFAISQEVHDQLKDNYDLESITVPNGIPCDQFVRRDQRKPGRPARLIQVSRLDHKVKGQHLLIEALVQNKDAEVDFVGIGPSEGYLKELAEKLGVEKRVHFLGQRDQTWIHAHLADYDVAVQPSLWEGFGLTVAEALAAQLPVLVSAGEGTAEVIGQGKYGWLTEKGSVQALSEQLTYILEHYDEALAKAEKGVSYVKENYDVGLTARRYLREYSRLQNRRRLGR